MKKLCEAEIWAGTSYIVRGTTCQIKDLGKPSTPVTSCNFDTPVSVLYSTTLGGEKKLQCGLISNNTQA